MLNKYFVPFDRSLKLKELGFEEPCFGYYCQGSLVQEYVEKQERSLLLNSLAPLFCQVFDWFREKYDLNAISPTRIYKTDLYQARIINWNNWNEIDVNQCDSYEEAQLTCLDKLIEICS